MAPVIVALAMGILAAPLSTEAQQRGKVYRVGYLGTTPPPSYLWEPLLDGLREQGWIEGRNIVFDRRFSEGRAERFPALATELVQSKVDILLIAGGPAPARAAMAATSTIPIVLVAVGDPITEKIVPSLARPGGTVTGLSMVVDYQIFGKRLEILKEAVPRISRVGVIYWTHGRPEETFSEQFKELEDGAKTLRVELVPALADTPDQFAEAFTAVTRERADALYVVESGLNFRYRQLIVDFAASNRLPAIGGWREFAEAGGLISYGVNLADLYRRAAGYVDRILKGAKPGDLPIEQPTKFELVINLTTAKALGITIPQSVLILADKVIQ